MAGDRERATLVAAGRGPGPLADCIPRIAMGGLAHTHEETHIFSLFSLPNGLLHFHSTGYIGEFEIIDDHRSGKIVVELTGRINKCGVISPRFDVQVNEIEKWIVNLLPSRQFGHILISTTYGIMTHEEARRKKTGGKILGFFY